MSVESALVRGNESSDGITLFAVTHAVRHVCGRIPSSLTPPLHLLQNHSYTFFARRLTT